MRFVFESPAGQLVACHDAAQARRAALLYLDVARGPRDAARWRSAQRAHAVSAGSFASYRPTVTSPTHTPTHTPRRPSS
jgi:hypothetical protein